MKVMKYNLLLIYLFTFIFCCDVTAYNNAENITFSHISINEGDMMGMNLLYIVIMRKTQHLLQEILPDVL